MNLKEKILEALRSNIEETRDICDWIIQSTVPKDRNSKETADFCLESSTRTSRYVQLYEDRKKLEAALDALDVKNLQAQGTYH